MAGDQLVVNFTALQGAVGDIQKAISKMESSLADCESSAKPLVDSWSGAAKDSYFERQAQWRKAADNLTQMLNDIKVAVSDSADNFDQTERRNTAMFQ